jgi:hypothetical protein
MKNIFYILKGAAHDQNGFAKFTLERCDGKLHIVSPNRLRQLRLKNIIRKERRA